MSWTAQNAAHCSACHRTFSGPTRFDQHRMAIGGEHGSCLDPAEMINGETGEHTMFFRGGMWRGPEMDVATIARRIAGGWGE